MEMEVEQPTGNTLPGTRVTGLSRRMRERSNGPAVWGGLTDLWVATGFHRVMHDARGHWVMHDARGHWVMHDAR